MTEPAKCWIGGGATYDHSRVASTHFTPAIAVPLDLLERLVEDAYYGPTRYTTLEECEATRDLIREMREEG